MEKSENPDIQQDQGGQDEGGLGSFIRASEYNAPSEENSNEPTANTGEQQSEPTGSDSASDNSEPTATSGYDWSNLGIEGVSSQEDLMSKWTETNERIKQMEENAKIGEYLSSTESNLGKAIIAAELEGKDAGMIVDLYKMDTDKMADSNAIFEKWYMENANYVSDRNTAMQVFKSQNEDLMLAAELLAMPEQERQDFFEENDLDASWLQKQKSIMGFEAAKAKQYLNEQKKSIEEYASKFKPSQAQPQQADDGQIQETVHRMKEWVDSTNELKLAIGDGKEVAMDLSLLKPQLSEIAGDANKAVSFLLGGDAATVMRNAAIVAAMSNPESAKALASRFASAMGEESIEKVLDNPSSPEKQSARPDRKDENFAWSKSPFR